MALVMSVAFLFGFGVLAVQVSAAPPASSLKPETSQTAGGWLESAEASPVIGATTTKTRTVTFAYDTGNRLVSQTEKGGPKVVYQFDAAGNLVTVTTGYGLYLPAIER